MLIFISFFLTILLILFYSFFELKEIQKNDIIKYNTKKWYFYNIKYHWLFLWLTIIIGIITIFNFNIISFILFFLWFIMYLFVHRPFLEKEIKIEEDFTIELKKDKSLIKQDFIKLIIRTILLYSIFFILYNNFELDINLILLIPFIISISFTDWKYGLIDDFQLILFLIVIFWSYFYNKEDLLFLPFSYFLFWLFIFLFEFLALKIFNKFKEEKREALLWWMDLITLYILFLAGWFHFLQIIIFWLTICIILYKFLKQKDNNIFFLFQFLHCAFIFYLILVSIFKF